MKRWAEANPQYEVREEDYKRFLRYPPARPLEGPLAENAAWAQSWFEQHGGPWWVGRALQTFEATNDGVTLEGIRFTSRVLAERAGRSTAAVIVAVSAGTEVDAESTRRWDAEEPDRYYFLQAWGAAVVAALLERARLTVASTFEVDPVRVRFGYAPGYPEWAISEMTPLLRLLRQDHELPGELDVLPSGMLIPKKSQLVLFFVENPSQT